MCYRLALCVLLFSPFVLNAQLVLGPDDTPQPDSSYIISTGINPFIFGSGPTGSNQSWDFGDITPTAQSVISYESGLNSLYGTNPLLWPLLNSRYGRGITLFPDAIKDILEDQIGIRLDDEYEFYDNDRSSAFRKSAFGVTVAGIPIASAYEDKEDVLRFPMAYQDSFVDSFKYEIGIPGQGGIGIAGEHEAEVDGWGEITLPLGTFECVRVRHVVRQEIDLSDFSEAIGTVPFTQIYIQWIGDREGMPLAQLNGVEVFGVTAYTSFEFQDFDRLPVVDFQAISSRTGCKSHKVVFENSTTDYLNYTYNFGDGTTSEGSFIDNVVETHTYTEPGTYQVRLTASNIYGERSRVRTEYITVGGPEAEFSVTETDLPGPNSAASFVNESQNASVYRWDFGDGVFSTDPNPTHFYQDNGSYSVRLIATDINGCRDTVLKTNVINVGQTSSRDGIAIETGSFSIYPNPATDQVTLQFGSAPTDPVSVRLLDLSGREIHRWEDLQVQQNGTRVQLNLPYHLQEGAFLLLTNVCNYSSSQLLTIQR